mgnify:CR=1 FL=1
MIVGSVAEVIGRQRRQLGHFLRGEAETVGDRTVDAVQRHTPIGRIVDPMTGADKGPSGKLRKSWRAQRVRRTAGGYESGAYTTLDYAVFVNDGTRKHVIHGKQTLRFWSGGTLSFYRSVKHPGTEGHFMAQKGVADIDREWATEGEVRLQAFIERTGRT